MRIDTAIKEYLLEIEVRRYSPRTVRSYRNNLNLFLRFCQERAGIENVEDITLGAVKAYTKFLVGASKASAYINSILKVIKSFVQYCFDTLKSLPKEVREQSPAQVGLDYYDRLFHLEKGFSEQKLSFQERY